MIYQYNFVDKNFVNSLLPHNYIEKNIINRKIFIIGFELIKIFNINNNINSIIISKTNSINKGPYILSSLLNDKNENKNDSIIEAYDDHNVFILPSFTEAHPQVLDESLARLRPVIIFPEIS